MEKNKKRERGANFSREETDRLISLIETKKHIIENKKSDAAIWHDKEQAWQALEIEFNSSGAETYRTAKHLKLKYEALKRDTRKKSTINRAEPYKTGEVPRLTPAEQKVKDMILSAADSDEPETASEEPDTPNPIFIETNVEVKRPFASCNSNESKPFDMLVEGNMENAELQRKLLLEELEEKKLKKQILQEELQHKKYLFQLEKEQMLLKIKILRAELENKKQFL